MILHEIRTRVALLYLTAYGPGWRIFMTERALNSRSTSPNNPTSLKQESLEILQRFNLTDRLRQEKEAQAQKAESPAAKLSTECSSLMKQYQREKALYESGGRHVKSPYPELDKQYVDLGCTFDKPKPDWDKARSKP